MKKFIAGLMIGLFVAVVGGALAAGAFSSMDAAFKASQDGVVSKLKAQYPNAQDVQIVSANVVAQYTVKVDGKVGMATAVVASVIDLDTTAPEIDGPLANGPVAPHVPGH